MKGSFINGNVAAEELTGYKREELIGKNFISLGILSKEEIRKAAGHLAKNAMGQATGPDEFTLNRKDGSQVPVEIRTVPTTLQGVRVVLGIARDISQRKSMEKELRESEERFRSMFDSMIAGVALHEITFDESGSPKNYRIIDANPAFEEQAGISRERAIGKLATELYGTGYPPYMEVYEHVALSGESTRFETFFSPMQKYFDISAFSPARGQFVTVFRDVTEEKVAETEIRKLSRAVEQSPTMIIITDIQGSIEYVNPKFIEVTGYTAEEVIGKNPRILMSGDTKSDEYNEMWETLHAGEEWRGVLRNKTKSGDPFWASVSITPIRDENEVISHILAIEEDITDRMEAEEELRASEEKYKDMVEIAVDGIITLDLVGRITSCNPAFEKLTGHPSDMFIGKHFAEIPTLVPNEIPKYLKMFKSIIQGKVGEPVEFLWKHLDGNTRKGEARVSLMRKEGRITGVQIIARDITERRKFEEKLQTLKDFNENIIQTMADGISLQDHEGKFTFINPAASKLLGYSIEELLGKHWTEIVPEDQHAIVEAANERRSYGESDHYEVQLMRKDDSRVDVLVSGSPLLERGEFVGSIAVFTDISKRIEIESELQRRLKEQTDLREAGSIVSISTDLEIILERIAMIMVEAIDATSVYICDFEKVTGLSTVLADSYGPRAHDQERESDLGVTYNLTEDFGETVEFLERRQPEIAHLDDTRLIEAEINHMKEYGAFSTLTIPFEVGGEVIGYAEIWESERRREFTEEEIELCQAIARQAAIAIQNNQLYEKAQTEIGERERTEAKLQDLLKEQTELREAAGILSSTLELDDVLSHIAEIMGQAVDATSAYIQSYDKEEQTVTVLANYHGPRVHEKERVSDLGITYNLSQDYPGTIEFLEAAIPLCVHFDDPEVDELERRHMVEFGAKSSLSIPIKVGGEVIAYADLYESERKREFTQEEIAACQNIAHHAGIAIQNSQLYEKAQNEIAERKVAQEALELSEIRFRSIFEGVEDAIFVESLKGEILEVNNRACEMFGYDREEFLTKTVVDLVPAGHTAVIPDENADEGIPDIPIETVNVRANGEKFPVELTARLQTIGDQTVMLAVVRDISDRKEADQTLELYRTELERSNEELAQFAYVASHDLQEPLRMVSSFMELLSMKYQDELDKDANEYIAFAIDGAQRMQRLIKDLLAYSRVGTRGKPFEPTDCNEVIDVVLTNLQVAIEESSAQISHDPLPTVLADEGQLVQLFQNLVGNAIKFIKDDSPVIQIRSELKGDDWLFSVQDNGIGIASEDFERIFGVSQRLHSIEEYPGTGLGLAISKKIVERHGGRIWVESELGKGSTFYISIPKERQTQPVE
jgi:PAS domain S-box-containing protein